MRRVVLLLLLPWGAALANGAGVTGASGASGPNPCAGCHSGGTFGAALSLSSGPTTVAPSSANDFELLLSSGGAPAGGFDLSASGGTLGVSSGTNGTGVQAMSGELTHTAPKAADGSGNVRWAFQWTAPSTPGTYTFHACAEPVDGDGTEAGDGPDACFATDVVVQQPDAAPTAGNDSYSTKFGTTLNKAAPGVLENDNDPDGDPLSVQLDTDVAHGSLTLNADGSFTYTPASGFEGQDTFKYRASDGTATSSLATVTITVIGDTAPGAVGDSYSTPFGTALNVAAPGVLANDSDADGDPLTAQKVTDVAHGTLTLNANGSFSYTPGAGYDGSDSFTYRASDGTKTSSAVSVQITIRSNNAPLAAPDSYSTQENEKLDVPAPGVLHNDTDANGDTLHAVKVTNPAHGSLTLRADGSFTYSPASGYHGFDSFTYQASDGFDNSGVTTVNISVGTPSSTQRAQSSDGGGGAPALGMLLVLALGGLARRVLSRAA